MDEEMGGMISDGTGAVTIARDDLAGEVPFQRLGAHPLASQTDIFHRSSCTLVNQAQF
jgi:hypothetical protein